jgi:asparagine synthase (glutamine-hydrolysing)
MPGLVISNKINYQRIESLVENESLIEKLCEPAFDCCFYNFSRPGYPIRFFKNGDLEIVLEGYIYNSCDEVIFSEIAQLMDRSDFETSILNWVSHQDGEFIFCVIDRTKERVIVFNDVLGRLPMYFFQNNEDFMVSRSIGSILDTFNIALSKEQVAIYLTLGYALNYQTIYQGVVKIKEHSLIVFQSGKFNFYYGNFLKELFDLPYENIDSTHLLKILKSALNNRLDHIGESALALSGGLDSRMLAALLPEREKRYRTITYHSADLLNHLDVQQASKISDVLTKSISNELVELSSVTNSDIEQLWKIKRGQNFLGMAFILPFLRVFEKDSLAQITGDGGDKTFDSIYPLIKIRSKSHLVKYIVSKNQVVPIDKVAKLTGLTSDHIYQLIDSNIDMNTEMSYDQHYAFFIMKERAMNWLFEGEDRNRYFCWSTTPFYSVDFLRIIFQIDPNRKKHGQLFKEIFDITTPELSTVVNPNWQVSLNNDKAIKKLFFRQKIKYYLNKYSWKKNKNMLTWDSFRKKYLGIEEEYGISTKSILTIENIQ